ncbi:MAG: zinc-binding dehydrogenase [bacterium]|nr:zinc-binding dehydrogenase [bacterium]
MEKMKAIVADAPGGPEVLELRKIQVPEPGPGQLLVRVSYAALNPLDTHARAARIEWNAPSFPMTPGYEFSGLVEGIGDGVDSAWLGKRVVSEAEWGGCAELALATASRVVEIPYAFGWQLGTVFYTCSYSAWHVLHTAGRLRASDTVLLHSAAGPIGLMATQIAKEAGARVIGLCGAHKFDFARPFGADELIDDRGDWVEEVRRLTDGRGADLIVDGVAGPEAPKNYEAVAPLGQVIYMGAVAGQPPPIDISRQLYAKVIAVRGFVVYTAMAQTGGEEKALIREALAEGRWKIPITRVFALAETAEAHRAFEARELYGKTLIEVGGEL